MIIRGQLRKNLGMDLVLFDAPEEIANGLNSGWNRISHVARRFPNMPKRMFELFSDVGNYRPEDYAGYDLKVIV